MIFLSKPTNQVFKDRYGELGAPQFGTNFHLGGCEPLEKLKLPEIWQSLTPHELQIKFFNSTTRFNISHAGRRSGKTTIAKRRLVRKAVKKKGLYIAAAPTFQQAKRIYWADLKKLVIPEFCKCTPSESELAISLKNDSLIWVTGLDVPARIEGYPEGVEHILLDEYGNMKADVWSQHVRPTLSDPNRVPGTADFIGVPEGRNHYYDLVQTAKDLEDWSVFHWPSSDIIPVSEIEAARRDLDEISYAQEYGGEFVSFSGLAYYCYTEVLHKIPQSYRSDLPLIFCFDFNVAPGVAAVLQEYDDKTRVIDEIHIEKNSNTPKVCAELCKRWSHHSQEVHIYGDATGGQHKTSQTEGHDWDLVKSGLTKLKTKWYIQRSNPSERSRVNAFNSRLKSIDGVVRFAVDPKCKFVSRDLEGVACLPDGSIDKKKDPKLTHISDAIGYYIVEKFPTTKRATFVEQW